MAIVELVTSTAELAAAASNGLPVMAGSGPTLADHIPWLAHVGVQDLIF